LKKLKSNESGLRSEVQRLTIIVAVFQFIRFGNLGGVDEIFAALAGF
jgi:hypothetical protein